MANSDYKNSGIASFATYVKNEVALDYLTTTIDYTEFNFDTVDAIQVGQAAMVDDEIMRITSVGIRTFDVARGCADTIPAPHAINSLVWILTGSVGTDRVEHSAGETVSVKVSPFTTGGGSVPIANVAPDSVEFDWRFFRPYVPGQMRVNAARWFEPVVIDDTTGSANLTWVHRDRALQSDQLVGHDDASIGPEPGSTYTMRVYNDGGMLLRTEYGIRGTSFMYQHAKALYDFSNPSSPVTGRITFSTERQAIESWQEYSSPITVYPSASPIPSEWQAFDQRTLEMPYIFSARKSLSTSGDYALAVAARPADRMSDDFALVHYWTEEVDTGEVDGEGNPIYETVEHTDVIDASTAYVPWVTIDFRLPELETTVNVRSSSLYDGVTVKNVAVASLALIDNELVVVQAFNPDGTITIGRGVGDTVPAVHIAGSRMWFFEADPARDPTARSGSFSYRFRPGVYGAPVNAATLPQIVQAFTQRQSRPYPVAQLVVNGRPWFEEAQATTGNPVNFSWAWRNRVEQGATALSHDQAGVEPEAGQTTSLRFFYETPAVSPGDPAVEHLLRQFSVSPAGGDEDGSFSYTYANALTDGNAAGLATGVCGTVVIYCRITSVRSGVESAQSYRVAIRVPSYPCPA